MTNYTVLDIENNNTNRYQRSAGNFMFDLIVAIGIKPKTEEAKAISTNIIPYNDETINNVLIKHLENQDLIIGHNLSHDLLFLWKYEALQDFFKRGGRIWDTMIAEYILTGQEHKYPKLRDITVNKYGCPERPKYIDDLLFNKEKTLEQLKHNIEQSRKFFPNQRKENDLLKEIESIESYKQVSDLPKELVLEDVKSDVLDTEQVALGQLRLAKKQGQYNLIKARCDGLLAQIEMEYNGMYINRGILARNKKELQDELTQVQLELNELVSRYWDV